MTPAEGGWGEGESSAERGCNGNGPVCQHGLKVAWSDS